MMQYVRYFQAAALSPFLFFITIIHSPMVQKIQLKEKLLGVPEGVEDYDKEMENDPFAVSLYANDIFKYYKQREVCTVLYHYGLHLRISYSDLFWLHIFI